MPVDVLKNPLWELMLSTNDCCPGCSCDLDRFEMTPMRVAAWVEQAKAGEPQQALDQVQALRESARKGTIDVKAVARQTNRAMKDSAAVVYWLERWEDLLARAIALGAGAMDDARRREAITKRFGERGRRK